MKASQEYSEIDELLLGPNTEDDEHINDGLSPFKTDDNRLSQLHSMSEGHAEDLLKLENYLGRFSSKVKSAEKPASIKQKVEEKPSRIDKYFYSREEIIDMITSFELEIRYPSFTVLFHILLLHRFTFM
jgi:hypothetical protein